MPRHARPAPTLLVVASPLEARPIIAALAVPPTFPFPNPHARTSAPEQAVDVVPDAWTVRQIEPGLWIVVTGIGKVNAAAATALALKQGSFERVISIGIAGALPEGSAVGPLGAPGARIQARLGQIVLGAASVYADEGLETPDGFSTCAEMGFPLGRFDGNSVAPDSDLFHLLTPLAEVHAPIATVSTCSGTDELAAQVRLRTGAAAECMEGAAVGHVCANWPRPGSAAAPEHRTDRPRFAELRVISNTTGDRARQQWDMKVALARLGELAAALPVALQTRA